jgi:PIN domain nuclease of toxin-antitoxin system
VPEQARPQAARTAGSRHSQGLQTLAISDLHAELAAAVDWDHGDPWGRILAAQVKLE